MLRISTLKDNKRMSTQDLLKMISEAAVNGETEFVIQASGQHDIGGPVWNRDGREIKFTVYNPGQRVGAMCLPGTRILVNGSVPADAGWLNSGGILAIKGDAGDTAGHCAASGKIYIGGRAGTRSGSLMKHDPDYPEPELWILKSCGSFSFEFMSGGKAVICGHDSQILPSVLGESACAGMVGGTIYFRGPVQNLSHDVSVMPLDEDDVAWLSYGMDDFLEAIEQSRLKKELSQWKHWRKIIPGNNDAKKTSVHDLEQYHKEEWLAGGIFANMPEDDFGVIPLVPCGEWRLYKPEMADPEKCLDCKSCLYACPRGAVQRRKHGERIIYQSNAERCTGCGICAMSCPEKLWKMEECRDHAF